MAVTYSLNKEITVVQDSFHFQRKEVLKQILAKLPARFPISELYIKLRDSFLEFTPLQNGCLFVYYDSLAKSMKSPIAATIYLVPHIDGR